MVSFDDVAANGEAQAGASQPRRVGSCLGGEEGLEDAPEVFRGDPHAVVDHTQLDQPARRVRALPLIAPPRRRASPGGH